MYKPNYNFFFKINNNWFRYISIFLIVLFFLFSCSDLFAQDADNLQSIDSMPILSQDSMDSNSDLDNDNQFPESDITTKIYRSTDNSGEVLHDVGSELDSALDADVINKEELVGKQLDSTNKISHRRKIKNKTTVKKSLYNAWVPLVLFVIILGLLFGLIKVIKKIRI